MLPSNLKRTVSMILEQLRREKGYSIATIAAHLGYASPNSIERIVRGQAGDTACKNSWNYVQLHMLYSRPVKPF